MFIETSLSDHSNRLCPSLFPQFEPSVSRLFFQLRFCYINCNYFACVDNSGKVTEEFEITPQSNYVQVFNDSQCVLYPRFDHSVIHCPVDVTWFPFDEQKCKLIFESWNMHSGYLELNVDDDIDYRADLMEPNEWHVIGACWRYCRFLLHWLL